MRTSGNTNANGQFTATVVNSTQFTIADRGVPRAGNGVYVAGTGSVITSGRLYVSDLANSVIHVFDTVAETELAASQFAFSPIAGQPGRPGPMAIDSRGDLWIIQEGADTPLMRKYAATYPTGIYCYHTNGTYTGKSITDVAFPTALAVDSNADRLLVCDNGPNQNVRIYTGLTNTTPTWTDTLGVAGGVYSGATPGLIYDPSAGGYARFVGLTGVGVDASGNYYVSGSASGSDPA